MTKSGIVVSDKTLVLLERLQGNDEMAIIYAEEAESLIDFILETQEQYSVINEKDALRHIVTLRSLSKDMNMFAQLTKKEGGAQ